jgi:hypothetical protein
MIGKLKVMAIAIPAIALWATGASAAASNPPVQTQSTAHGALGHAGKAKGPDATGPAKRGLCMAFGGRADHAKGHSVALRNLQKAASAAGKSITQFCAGVTPGNSTPDENESTSSTGSTPPENPGGRENDDQGNAPPRSMPGSSDHSSTSTPAGHPTSTPAGKP